MSSPAGGTLLAGKYRLERPLNAGGMGSVWVARHVELDVEVAVKLISWVQALKPVAVERFKREARAAAQIRSPHVVQILDYGVHEGVPYMAMELLGGEDLADHLSARGRITPQRALEILKPVCKVLGLAHQAGIVHRDIKPANIFLARAGDEEVVKVLDFGIAKETNREAQHTTGTGLVGSPLYMSPEQIKGSDVDAQSDLWSVAVVLYEALAGETPFEAPALGQLFQAVSTTDAPPISSKIPELAVFDEFFRRGLAREKTGRFVSVRDLLFAFEDATSRAPEIKISAPIRISAVAARSGAGSTEALAPTAEVGSLQSSSGGAASSKAETLYALAELPSSDELSKPKSTTRGASAGLWVGVAAGGLALVGLGAVLATQSMSAGGGDSAGSAVARATLESAAAPGSLASTVASPTQATTQSEAPSVTPSASATSSAPVVSSASGLVASAASGPPRPPPAGKPSAATPTPLPPATDPIWGVPVSQPKR